MGVSIRIMNTPSNSLTSRREFLKTSALVGGALAAPAIFPGQLLARENTDTLRVGLDRLRRDAAPAPPARPSMPTATSS